MDKIAIDDYISDLTIDDESPVNQADCQTSQYLYFIAPSPQLLNWLIARGWSPISWYLTDPTAITDYAYLAKVMFDEGAVLQVLINEFTDAYNAGRTINDDRYDEIIALLAVVVDKTEDELNSIEDDEDTFEALVDAVITNLSTEYTTHNTDVSGSLDDWADSERTRIDDAFEADLAAQTQQLIDRGMYNSTTLNSITTGNTTGMANADSELEDKITQRQLELKERLYDKQVDIRMKFLEARNRLIDILHKQGSYRTEVRNKVVEVVTRFAESRTDDYPSFLEPLNALLNVAVSQKSQGWT